MKFKSATLNGVGKATELRGQQLLITILSGDSGSAASERLLSVLKKV